MGHAGCATGLRDHNIHPGRVVADSDLPLTGTNAVPRTELRGARVLVVDDSDIVRDVSRSLLEDAGIIVEEAADGAAALTLMRENAERCQLILMDVQMPVLDGMAATRAIRGVLGDRTPPIVALTAQATDDERRNCREAGMCDHLTKPVDPQRLIDTVQRWLAPLPGTQQFVPANEVVASPREAYGQALPAVPGFDLQAGLQCVGGKTGLLRSQLARFGATYADAVAQLRQLLQAQAYRDARRLAHTLKGAAATLGGAAIAHSAGQVEQGMLHLAEPVAGVSTAALPPAQLDTALWELEAALRQALPALRDLAAAQSGGAPARVAVLDAAMPPALADEYASLRQLLADNCYAARKAFAALREQLGADDDGWRAAAAAVEALDFGRALAHLDTRYPASSGGR